MNYLAIDTSGKNLTIVIKKGEEVFTFNDPSCGVSHSIELMPRVEELAKKADFDFNSASFFAAVVGAGSFTGIRIGVATVKALCFAFSKPALSVTSFDTIAYNKECGKVLAIIDAKHNGFYVCGYEDKKIVYPPSYVMRETLEELKKDYKLLSFSDIDGFDVEIVSVAEGLKKAIEEKSEEINDDLSALEPLYVRKSQAEEGR